MGEGHDDVVLCDLSRLSSTERLEGLCGLPGDRMQVESLLGWRSSTSPEEGLAHLL